MESNGAKRNKRGRHRKMMFDIIDGKKIFRFGKTSYGEAAEAAKNCDAFRQDYEEEVITDDEKSCYNCRYRRWTKDGFQCMKN